VTDDHHPADPLERGADQIRETVKWLTAALAAVAAALIAGSQLTNLGEASGWRLVLAIVGFLAGIGSVAAAIWFAVQSFKPTQATLGSLDTAIGSKSEDGRAASAVESLSGLFEGFGPTLSELQRQYDDAVKERKSALESHFADPGDQRKKDRAQFAESRAQWIAGVVQNVLAVANHYKVWWRFERSLPRIFGAALIGAVGIAFFVYAANPPLTSGGDAPSNEPTVVRLAPTPEVRRLIEGTAGGNCRIEGRVLDAVLLSSSESNIDIVTVPSPTCHAVRLILPPDTQLAVVSPVPLVDGG
jgi:hypothetical protein